MIGIKIFIKRSCYYGYCAKIARPYLATIICTYFSDVSYI